MISSDDISYLRRAAALAQRGEGFVNPNPLVGAVIVRDGRIIAEGYHPRFRDLHAERVAIADAIAKGESLAGSTIYVTLEPCCHHGNQPPCTEAILEHGIKRVVVGLPDPNPLVAGKGIEILRQAGVEVEMISSHPEGEILLGELRYQNRVFLKYITTKMPWVTAKWAMTIDGKIATHTGDSRWVTGDLARERVHLVRSRLMAVMVGIGTVLADDPMLNCRLSEERLRHYGVRESEVRQPIRIIADRQLRIPLDSQLVATAHEYPTIVAFADGADEEKAQQLLDAGVHVWNCNTLKEILQRAGDERIDSILLESGGTLNEAFFREGFIDEVMAFVAPKVVGGKGARTPVEGEGVELMSEAVSLRDVTMERIGKDMLLTALVEKK